MTPYNILLMMADEMRGDCLGIAGHPDVKTPWLDTLAASGIRFENAYSTCPSCIAARAELHTGMRPAHTGRVGYQDGIAWRYPHTMAGEFTKAGFQTACIGKMHVHPLRNSLGYEQVELHDGYLHYYRRHDGPYYEDQRVADDYFYWLKQNLGAQADVTDTGLDCNSFLARPLIYEEKYHPTNWVTDRTLDFLRRRDHDRPFFLTVSYVRPHAPYDAPEAYFDMYRHQTLSEVPVGGWADPDTYKREGRNADTITSPSDPELLLQSRVGYYACISHLDAQIGRILMALREQKLNENTIVIFLSDHGEMLGDHHFDRKCLPYQGSIHIPMILQGPRDFMDGREGTVSKKLTALRDVMPTLLLANHLRVPDSVDGMDMMDTDIDRYHLHGEHTFGKLSSQFIVTAEDKYIWFSQTGREQYFDLRTDPMEIRDAIDDPVYRPRVRELRERLIDALEGREERFTDGEALYAGRPQSPVLRRVLGKQMKS